jgi:hypothetical protein
MIVKIKDKRETNYLNLVCINNNQYQDLELDVSDDFSEPQQTGRHRKYIASYIVDDNEAMEVANFFDMYHDLILLNSNKAVSIFKEQFKEFEVYNPKADWLSVR